MNKGVVLFRLRTLSGLRTQISGLEGNGLLIVPVNEPRFDQFDHSQTLPKPERGAKIPKRLGQQKMSCEKI